MFTHVCNPYFFFIKHSRHFTGYHDTIIPANFCDVDADEYDDYCDGSVVVVGDVLMMMIYIYITNQKNTKTAFFNHFSFILTPKTYISTYKHIYTHTLSIESIQVIL